MDRSGPSGRAKRGGVVRPIKRPGGVGGDVAPSLAIKDWTASWTLRVGEYEIMGELLRDIYSTRLTHCTHTHTMGWSY